ncbi:MAG TPA: nickel-responsive transcriptional regulator NikR [Draconibacterium sp.]|nr:nickel-responsive transcriptional regulator NikR [Draconibacterium sp.]
MTVSRFGISIEQDLLEALDEYVRDNQFANRSQAIRQLISRNVVEKKWQCNNKVAGAINLIYDPRKLDISKQLAVVEEEYYEEILSSQRYMLHKYKCLQIVAAKGIASRLTDLSDKLITIKGIEHGKLTMTRAD